MYRVTKYNTIHGFTLIELLLYVAISSVILLGVVGFFSALLQARIKGQVIAEVDGQGMRAMQIMVRTVRNSTAIDTPPAGRTRTNTWVEVPNSSLSPTYFEQTGTALTIAEHVRSQRIPLTNSQVMVSNLAFTNETQSTGTGVLRIQFTLTYVNSTGRNEYDYSKTFTDTVTLRAY